MVLQLKRKKTFSSDFTCVIGYKRTNMYNYVSLITGIMGYSQNNFTVKNESIILPVLFNSRYQYSTKYHYNKCTTHFFFYNC